MDAAVKHCIDALGIWPWASTDQGIAPDVVMACCGDVPTLKTLAARHRPHEAAAANRAPAWVERYRVRFDLHQGQDRFHLVMDTIDLVMDTIDRVPQIRQKGIDLKQQLEDKLLVVPPARSGAIGLRCALSREVQRATV